MGEIENERDKALSDRDVAERSLNVIEDENTALRQANDDLLKRLDALQEGGGVKSKELTDELDAAKAETARVTEEASRAAVENTNLANQLAAAQQQAASLERQLAEKTAEAGNLAEAEKRVVDLDDKLASADERIKELEEELATKTEAAGKLGDSEKQAKELAEELEDAKSEAETARNARDAAQDELKELRDKFNAAQKEIGSRDELQRKLEARDRQIDVAQQQLNDLREELKLEEEERARAAEDLRKAREAEERAIERIDVLEGELDELKAKLADAEKTAVEAAGQSSAESEELASLKEENAAQKLRTDEITKKRDEVLQGLESAVGELDAMRELLAGRDVDLRTAQGERDQALSDAEALRKEIEGMRALQAEIEELEARHKETADELVRVGGAFTNAEQAAEKWREEIDVLKQKIEQTTEQRHEAEKQLVEARAKLEAEQQIRDEHNRRIDQLEDALERERQAVDKSAPAEALSSLSSQLANEREKWESHIAEKDAELDDVRKRMLEAEARESDLSAQLEGVQLSRKDVNRAKALAGQRRAQIERMQGDVETARRQAKEAETYWKDEMSEFQGLVAQHLLDAENNKDGSDQKLQKLMESMKVGVADKYAKLRRKANRMDKELTETKDKLTAVERILAKREEEEARLKTIIDEMEARERVPGAKKKADEDNPKKTPAKKKSSPKKK